MVPFEAKLTVSSEHLLWYWWYVYFSALSFSAVCHWQKSPLAKKMFAKLKKDGKKPSTWSKWHSRELRSTTALLCKINLVSALTFICLILQLFALMKTSWLVIGIFLPILSIGSSKIYLLSCRWPWWYDLVFLFDRQLCRKRAVWPKVHGNFCAKCEVLICWTRLADKKSAIGVSPRLEILFHVLYKRDRGINFPFPCTLGEGKIMYTSGLEAKSISTFELLFRKAVA